MEVLTAKSQHSKQASDNESLSFTCQMRFKVKFNSTVAHSCVNLKIEHEISLKKCKKAQIHTIFKQ